MIIADPASGLRLTLNNEALPIVQAATWIKRYGENESGIDRDSLLLSPPRDVPKDAFRWSFTDS